MHFHSRHEFLVLVFICRGAGLSLLGTNIVPVLLAPSSKHHNASTYARACHLQKFRVKQVWTMKQEKYCFLLEVSCLIPAFFWSVGIGVGGHFIHIAIPYLVQSSQSTFDLSLFQFFDTPQTQCWPDLGREVFSPCLPLPKFEDTIFTRQADSQSDEQVAYIEA